MPGYAVPIRRGRGFTPGTVCWSWYCSECFFSPVWVRSLPPLRRLQLTCESTTAPGLIVGIRMCTAAVTIITAVIGITGTTVTAGGTIISPNLWMQIGPQSPNHHSLNGGAHGDRCERRQRGCRARVVSSRDGVDLCRAEFRRWVVSFAMRWMAAARGVFNRARIKVLPASSDPDNCHWQLSLAY